MLLLIGVNGGLGGGAVVNGEIVRGADGYAGEFGHMRISDQSRLDYSGIPGTLEALVRREDLVTAMGLGDVDDDQLIAAVTASKSKRLEKLLDQQTHYLARAIGVLLNAFNPEIVVLAGFLEIFVRLRERELRKQIKDQSLSFSSENLKIVTGTRGSDLLLVGAAELGFRDLLENPLDSELTEI
jgi:predicted NBD/HSP70 family sugar kinase